MNHDLTHRRDIDGVRAIAIALVVAFHAFGPLAPGGFIGVDVFFVISGYLITGIIVEGLRRGTFSFTTFYVRRIRRIAPALSLMLAAVFAFGWLVLLPDELARLGRHIIASAAFFANLQFWLETGYFDTSAFTKPLLHLWSLGVEEQFYLFWPLALWFAYRRGWNLTAVTAGVLAISFAINVAIAGVDEPADFYLPTSRLWELLAGALLAVTGARCPRTAGPLREVAALAGLALIGAGVACINASSVFPGWWALLPVSGSVLLIWAGSENAVSRYVIGSRPLVALGLISYPLYLWHWPILSFGHILANGEPTFEYRVCAVLASIVLAWATYEWVEIPVRRSRTRLLPVGLLASLAVIALAGSVIGSLPRPALAYRIDPRTITVGDGGQWAVDGCGVSDTDRKSIRDCYSDRRETPIYALWGDSHATALLPGVLRESTPGARWLDVGAGGCPPMSGVRRVEPGLPGYNTPVICTATNAVAMQTLQSNPHIRGVVFVTASRMVTANYYARGPHDKAYPDAIVDGMSEAAQRLHAAGKAVYFLVDNPAVADPKQCLSRLITVSTDDPVACEIPLSRFEAKTEDYRRLLEKLKVRDPFIDFIDPTALLCPDAVCPVAIDGKFLYTDSDHLSDTGNGLVARYLIDQITAPQNKPVTRSAAQAPRGAAVGSGTGRAAPPASAVRSQD